MINEAGNRLSTAEMEKVKASYPANAECAEFWEKDEFKAQVSLALVVLE